MHIYICNHWVTERKSQTCRNKGNRDMIQTPRNWNLSGEPIRCWCLSSSLSLILPLFFFAHPKRRGGGGFFIVKTAREILNLKTTEWTETQSKSLPPFPFRREWWIATEIRWNRGFKTSDCMATSKKNIGVHRLITHWRWSRDAREKSMSDDGLGFQSNPFCAVRPFGSVGFYPFDLFIFLFT